MGFDELIQHDLSEMTDGIGNGLTGGSGSPVGIAGGGVGNAELDNGAAFTFNGDLTLGQASQDFVLQQAAGFSPGLELRSQASNKRSILQIRDADNDALEQVGVILAPFGGLGETDSETARIQWNPSDGNFQFLTLSTGTGSARGIELAASNSNKQIFCRTDGNVAMNNGLLVGSTGAATNALGVSGGMAVGKGFAGSNTAPTDGLLVEGGVSIGTISNDRALHVAGKIRSKHSNPRLEMIETNTTDGNVWLNFLSGQLRFQERLDGGAFNQDLLTVDVSGTGVAFGKAAADFLLDAEGGRGVHLGCPTAGNLTTADMDNGSISFEVDETNNELDVTVKKSGGTVVTGTVALS